MDRSDQWAETGVGAVVILAAALFLFYALSHGGGLGGPAGYELVARFGQVGSLARGADVRVAGVKVGAVSRIDLDPKTFQAEAHLMLDRQIQLPADSTAKITSDSLLGGQHVAIEPGGAADVLKPGAQFENTQGAVDLFGLIGQVLRPQGAAPAANPGQAAPSSTTP